MPDITLTGILSIYGAIVSTIVLAWNLRKDLRDRGRMSISVVTEVSVLVGDKKLSVSPNVTKIKVVNRGRRACTIQAVGIVENSTVFGGIGRRLFGLKMRPINSRRDSPHEIHFAELPKRLEYEEVWIGKTDWQPFYLIKHENRVSFYVEDTLGRCSFTKRFKATSFKDPSFEDESQLPYTIDQEVRDV